MARTELSIYHVIKVESTILHYPGTHAQEFWTNTLEIYTDDGRIVTVCMFVNSPAALEIQSRTVE
jgi:hypothetical protein